MRKTNGQSLGGLLAAGHEPAAERGLLVGIGSCGIRAAKLSASLSQRLARIARSRIAHLTIEHVGNGQENWAGDMPGEAGFQRTSHRAARRDQQLLLRQLVRSLLRRDDTCLEEPGAARLACLVFCDLGASNSVRSLQHFLNLLSQEVVSWDVTVFAIMPRTSEAGINEEDCHSGLESLRTALEREFAVQRVFVVDGRDEAGWWAQDADELVEIAATAGICRLAPVVSEALRRLLPGRGSPAEPTAHSFGSVGLRRFRVGAALLSGVVERVIVDRLCAEREAAGPADAVDAVREATTTARAVLDVYTGPDKEDTDDRLSKAREVIERGLVRVSSKVGGNCRGRLVDNLRAFLSVLADELERNAPGGLWMQEQQAKVTSALDDLYRRVWQPVARQAQRQKPPVRKFLAASARAWRLWLAASITAMLLLAAALLGPFAFGWLEWEGYLLAGFVATWVAALICVVNGSPHDGEVTPGRVVCYLALPGKRRGMAGTVLWAASLVALASGAWWWYRAEGAELAALARQLGDSGGPLWWRVVTGPVRFVCGLGWFPPALSVIVWLCCGFFLLGVRILAWARVSDQAMRLPRALDRRFWGLWSAAVAFVSYIAALFLLALNVFLLNAQGPQGLLVAGGVQLCFLGVLVAVFPAIARHREQLPKRPEIPPPPPVVPMPKEGCERIVRWARNLASAPRMRGESAARHTLLDYLVPGWAEEVARDAVDRAFGWGDTDSGTLIVAELLQILDDGFSGTASLEEIVARLAVRTWIRQENWSSLLCLIGEGDDAVRRRLRAIVPLQWDSGSRRPWHDAIVLFDEEGEGKSLVLDLSNPDERLVERLGAFLGGAGDRSTTLVAVRLGVGLARLSPRRLVSPSR